MEFGILGPLSVVTNGRELEVSGAQRRAVLALLLVRANRTVAADVLIDELWNGQAPKSASTTLQTYVYQLRKSLGLDALHTRPTGYALEVAPDELDALRFERAVRIVERASGTKPEWAAARLREALGWWRGPALADFEGLAWAQPEAARLEGLRLGALEALVDARLALGEHVAVSAEVEALVAEHPLRERLWAQLMLSLYRSERQADALRAFSRLRAILGDELGIEPGREVTRLETAILRHDPALDLPRPALEVPVTREDRPRGNPVARSRPGRHRRAILAGAGAVLIALALAASGLVVTSGDDEPASRFAVPTEYHPRLEATSCPTSVRQSDSSARCAALIVPENRDRPRGRKTRLGVYVFPAQVANPAPDPVVQVLTDLRLIESPSDGILRGRGDSIVLAGRGFSLHGPRLTCPEVSAAANRALSRPVRAAESRSEFLQAVESCRARWDASGVDLASYSAKETAADVRDLAAVLGAEQLNLVAGRHSTDVAREVAGRYPGLVRSLLLFNVAPPDANRWNGAITNQVGAFERYFAECAAQPRCEAAFPDLPAQLRFVYQRNRDAPVSFTTTDPSSSPPVEILLDGDRTMQFSALALSDPVAVPLLAAALADPESESGQAAVDFGARYVVSSPTFPWGALFSRLCVDEIASLGRSAVQLEAKASQHLGYPAADPLLDVCPIWRVSPGHSRKGSPVATPTLILQGDLDPFTSPSWADTTARNFGRATVVRLAHVGDAALAGDACVLDLRRGFLARPEKHISSDACRDQTAPIEFGGT